MGWFNGDQRRLTGSNSTLEAFATMRYTNALYKSTFTLLYFTYFTYV